MNLGWILSALVIPMRCLWPPLNWWGYFCKSSGVKPTLVINSQAVSNLSFSVPILWIANGSVTISRIFIFGSREEYTSWNSIWKFFRKSLSWCSGVWEISKLLPLKLYLILPSVGGNNFTIHLPTVVLPEPLSPTSPTVSPFFMCKLISLTALLKLVILLKNPLRFGKNFFSPSTSRILFLSMI